jgi:hypothetical protein
MSEAQPGEDRHLWATEYESLAEELRTEPAEALPELLGLVERMLHAAGYEGDVPGPAEEPEVEAGVERAREIVRRWEGGGPIDNDDAFQAAAELRELYQLLIDRPEAEAGADLRGVDEGGG